MNNFEPVVTMHIHADGQSLRLEYQITNNLDEPVCIFDRLYDMDKKKLSENWAYLAFENGRAVVSRQTWPLPRGLHHDSPEVPYARFLPQGGKAAGKVVLPLPLVEGDPYYGMRHRNAKQIQVNLTVLTFRIGWARVSDLRGGSSLELENERLALFPYAELIAKQRLTGSQPAIVHLLGSVAQ